MKTLALLFFFALGSLSSSTTERPVSTQVVVELSTTAARRGFIRLAIFTTPESLDKEEPIIGKVIEFNESTTSLSVVLDDLPQGAFTIAAYHDLNGNNKLDRNLFGVPSEPYGFSGQPASKWRAPEWDEIVLSKADRQQPVKLDLRYWKEM